MRNQSLHSELQRIRSLIDRTSVATTQDIGLHIHWGQYLCVLAAGFLENSLETIYSDFARCSSSPQAARFVSERLKEVYNPNVARFVQTAGEFDLEWQAQLNDFLDADPDRRKGGINSIMSNRHKIAHGESVNVSPARVKDYLNRAVEVLEFIENQCNG